MPELLGRIERLLILAFWPYPASISVRKYRGDLSDQSMPFPPTLLLLLYSRAETISRKENRRDLRRLGDNDKVSTQIVPPQERRRGRRFPDKDIVDSTPTFFSSFKRTA
jgi:hypothetical protein